MSDGGLKVGDAYVSFGAGLGDLYKAFDQILRDVEEMADGIANAMGQAADVIGGFSDGLLSVAAAAGAAVAGAAEYSEDAKNANEDLKNSVLQLSAEVGATFLPLVRELNDGVRTLTATWRGLSSETRAQIVDAVRYAAVVGVAGKATSMSIGWAKSLAEGTVLATKGLRAMGPAVFKGFSAVATGAKSAAVAFTWFMHASGPIMGAFATSIKASMATLAKSVLDLKTLGPGLTNTLALWRTNLMAVGVPILAVAAAVAGLVLLSGTLYRTWNDSSVGLRDSVLGIINSIRALAAGVVETFTSIFDSFMGFVLGLSEAFLEVLASKVRTVAKFAEDIARRTQNYKWADNLAQVQNLTGAGMVKAVKDQVAGVVDAARAKLEKAGESLKEAGRGTGEAIGYGLSYSLAGVKDILRDSGLGEWVTKLQGMLGGFQLGDPNSVEQGATLADKDKAYQEWLKSLEAPLQTLAYETAAEAKRALEAEVRANEETLRAVEEAAAAELEMAQANAAAAAEAAQEAHRARVEELYAASEMSAELADMARQLAEEAQQRMEEARQALAGKLSSAFSSVTSIVDSFTTGMAASGGNPLVGLLAALGDILMRSEGFQVLLEMVNTIIQDVANALDALLVPLQPLLGAVAMVTQALGEALAPALGMLGELLEPIVPVVALVGVILEALAPVFDLVTQLLGALMAPLKVLADVVLKGLFELLRGLAIVALSVIKGLGEAWNGIVGAVQSVFRALSEINVLGGKPLEFLGVWADGLNSATVPLDGLTESMAALNAATWDGTRARAEETAASVRNRQALQDATEALTNVPSAWRRLRAQYLAQDPQGPGGGGMGPGTPGAPGTPTAPAQQPPVVVNNHYTTYSPEETGRAVQRRLDEIAFRRGGNRTRGVTP